MNQQEQYLPAEIVREFQETQQAPLDHPPAAGVRIYLYAFCLGAILLVLLVLGLMAPAIMPVLLPVAVLGIVLCTVLPIIVTRLLRSRPR